MNFFISLLNYIVLGLLSTWLIIFLSHQVVEAEAAVVGEDAAGAVEVVAEAAPKLLSSPTDTVVFLSLKEKNTF